MSKLKEVKRIPLATFGLNNASNRDFRIAIDSAAQAVIVSEYVPDEVEVTADCSLLICERRSQNGVYGKLMFEGQLVAVIDLLGKKEPSVYNGYRLERSPSASYSVRVFKVNS